MFKKSVVLAIVMVMLVSFSAAVFAGDKEETDVGQAPKNKAGVKVLVENDENGETENYFLPAVPTHAKDNPSEKGPSNPIAVAGK